MTHTAHTRLMVALGSTLILLSCGEIAELYEPCSAAQDCPAPWVCCSEQRLPTLDPQPVCEEIRKCITYMPLMAEGQPCNRLRQNSLDEQCRADLECCPDTLTCVKPGQCTPPTVTPPERGSGLACGADLDCGSGEICCNIAFRARAGACATVAECTSGEIPVPDAVCAPPTIACNNTCIDPRADDLNCGMCGQRCDRNTICSDGICESRQATCTAPFVDCNGDPNDNCEADTGRNRFHCGACDNACPMFYPNGSDLGCQEGQCVYVCNGGFHDCNDNPVDGCESTTRCP